MTATARTSRTGPLAWTGAQLREQEDWCYTLSAAELGELGQALDAVRDRPIDRIARADFPLPTLGPSLHRLGREVLDGRGFVLLRGIDVASLDVERAARAFWGVGTWLGVAVSQNPNGHLLGHVTDIGAQIDNPDHRGYQSAASLPFHTDVGADIVALFCLRPAKHGGASSVVSGVTLYNVMLERRPDLLALLCQPLAWDRRGEVPPGCQPWYELPVFAEHAGRLLVAFVRRFIVSAERHGGVRPLDQRQLEALDYLQTLAADPSLHLAMDFRPGDAQFVNNHAILHSRTGYTDFQEPAKRRHLLRLWLAAGDGWELPAAHYERYPGRTADGRPAGITTTATRLQASLDPTAA